MTPRLLEPRLDPEDAEKYHFKIRGWDASELESGGQFDEFICRVHLVIGVRHTKLKTASITTFGRGEVALIKLKGFHSPKDIERLCMAIVHPGAREEIKQLTSRSLLGVSALRLDNAEERWQKAVFETALEYGHPYVREIFSQTLPKNKIPGWAITLLFAITTGTNLGGYVLRSSPRTKRGVSDLIVELYGSRGVRVAAGILEELARSNKNAKDLSSLRARFYSTTSSVEGNIRSIERRLRTMRTARYDRDELRRICREAHALCYEATNTAAQAFIADDDIRNEYFKARKGESNNTNAGGGIIAALSIGAAALSVQTVPAAISLSAAGSFIVSLGTWPTVLAVTSPPGFILGAVGLTIAGFTELQKRQEVRRFVLYQNVIILISRCCNIVNVAMAMLACIEDHAADTRAADRFFKDLGINDLRKQWLDFRRRDQKKKKGREDAKEKGLPVQPGTAKNMSERLSMSAAQRLATRFVKEFIGEQRAALNRCLTQLYDGKTPGQPSSVGSGSEDYSEEEYESDSEVEHWLDSEEERWRDSGSE